MLFFNIFSIIKNLNMPYIDYNFIFKIYIALFFSSLFNNFNQKINILHLIFLFTYFLLFSNSVSLRQKVLANFGYLWERTLNETKIFIMCCWHDDFSFFP
jgi:hypothetical protein